MPGEKAPRGLPFIRRLALGEIGIAQPVPVAVGYQRRDHGLVAQQIGLPRREGVLIEVHVRPGVIAEHLPRGAPRRLVLRSEEPTAELQSLMRISYAVFCLK